MLSLKERNQIGLSKFIPFSLGWRKVCETSPGGRTSFLHFIIKFSFNIESSKQKDKPCTEQSHTPPLKGHLDTKGLSNACHVYRDVFIYKVLV